jgi:voltage-gated potassium channel
MMNFRKFRRMMVKYFVDMRWYTIVSALIFYGLSSWLMLYLAGEKDLLSASEFIYWLVVTGSTVGYGDLSPSTVAGKYVVAIYIIPLGLSIFAMVIGRIAAWVSFQWQRGAKGLKSLDVNEHILVIGWNEQRTIQLLNLLLRERASIAENPDIVLCVRADISNPMPGLIEFVKVTSFNKDEDMDRACIARASVILMDNPEDDQTMTTALYCSQRNPDAHLIAYFKDESLVKLLQLHCPNVECTPSVAVEMLAKSAFDPGSSMLHHDLLNVEHGQAQYSAAVALGTPPIKIATLFIELKKQYEATFIGYAQAGARQQIFLNPSLQDSIHGGDKVYYIADERIPHIDWHKFVGADDV